MREELVRRNRNELIRRAREDGVAVDLDELARIGSENVEMAERRSRADRTKSFDTMVGSDGMLKTTGNDASEGGARKRGAAGFAAGAAVAATMGNPFSDENVLFDVGGEDEDEEDAPSPKEFTYVEASTRETSATVEAESPAAATSLIDLNPEPATETLQETDQAVQSFYSFTSSASHTQDPLAQTQFFDNEVDHMSAGTLTPRSERSHSIVTGASVAGSNADDIGILSMQNDTDHDARSEIFSEGGFTDAGFSEFGDNDRTGIMTPNSWTDVGSDDESDWGGAQGNGHVSQVHQ
jgi:hypothetical protein